jgi:aldehyde dehydrogenase (NAD+)
MPTVSEVLKSMEYGPAPEAADIANEWLKRGPFGHFINGTFTEPTSLFATMNPATGDKLADVSQGDAATVDNAVAAARTAFPAWSGLPGHARAKYLYAIARHIQKRERLFAVLETLDNGKPIRESRDIDVPLVARHFYHHAGWAELMEAEFPGHRPQGVCGQIIPWNFPLLMLAWKVAPALAAGNTVVLKPAEYTSLTALAFAEVCREIGLPNGVVNIVTGDGATGAALVAHPDVNKIAFTGSTDVGRQIRAATAGSGKALTLELGGKSPFMVFADADLDAAVEGVVDAIWFNQGEVCCAGSRILVQESIAEVFTDRLRARMGKLRVGNPLDKSTDIGAIVHPDQLARIQALVARAQAEGAKLEIMPAPNGCFCAPGLLTNIAPSNPAVVEEIFGPIAVLMTFRTPAEAIEMANATRYGLAASIWSENINVALDMAAQVKAGIVWINATNVFDANAPFGGMRESGFGREGAREGMQSYLTSASDPVTVDTPRPALSALPSMTAQPDGIDRTPKLYIGGAHKRADAGQSYSVQGADGQVLGQAPLGSRKDIRNAVEAAHKAKGWGKATGHNRAQVLYYLAENIADRGADLTKNLRSVGVRNAADEVESTIRRAFFYAAWADKFDGRVHSTQTPFVTLAMKEPFGVMGLVCPETAPLLGFMSMLLPAIAMGNAVVAIPSQSAPLPALALSQIFDTSDIPAGVINIVSGPQDALAKTLAEHDDVAALWYSGGASGAKMVEAASAGNLKPVWADTSPRDWVGVAGQDSVFLQNATQIKTIWIPYGA